MFEPGDGYYTQSNAWTTVTAKAGYELGQDCFVDDCGPLPVHVSQSLVGLGVTTDGVIDPDINNTSAISNNFLTLSFDRMVKFQSVLFDGYDEGVDGDDHVDIYVDGVLKISNFLIETENPLDLSAYAGSSISFGAEFNEFEDLYLFNDFTVASLTAQVPLPAGVFLLGGAVGGLAALRRRRKAA
ncbi:MAG: VPLPA-CTERM sorting domain-containing protein [Pseudooceanicola sp.]